MGVVLGADAVLAVIPHHAGGVVDHQVVVVAAQVARLGIAHGIQVRLGDLVGDRAVLAQDDGGAAGQGADLVIEPGQRVGHGHAGQVHVAGIGDDQLVDHHVPGAVGLAVAVGAPDLEDLLGQGDLGGREEVADVLRHLAGAVRQRHRPVIGVGPVILAVGIGRDVALGQFLAQDQLLAEGQAGQGVLAGLVGDGELLVHVLVEDLVPVHDPVAVGVPGVELAVVVGVPVDHDVLDRTLGVRVAEAVAVLVLELGAGDEARLLAVELLEARVLFPGLLAAHLGIEVEVGGRRIVAVEIADRDVDGVVVGAGAGRFLGEVERVVGIGLAGEQEAVHVVDQIRLGRVGQVAEALDRRIPREVDLEGLHRDLALGGIGALLAVVLVEIEPDLVILDAVDPDAGQLAEQHGLGLRGIHVGVARIAGTAGVIRVEARDVPVVVVQGEERVVVAGARALVRGVLEDDASDAGRRVRIRDVNRVSHDKKSFSALLRKTARWTCCLTMSDGTPRRCMFRN